MPKRSRHRMTDKEFEQARREMEEVFEEFGEEQRHWVQHSCGHSHRHRRIPKDELRQQLEKVECPWCQRQWNRN